MAANASSNDSLAVSSHFYCFFIAEPSSQIFAWCNIMKILLLLPLCLLVIYLDLQRRRSSSAAAATSHWDSFTFHMVAMELVGVFGYILNCCGVYWNNFHLFRAGLGLSYFHWYGEMFLHVLTCVERYLAVVHPVTYLSLRGQKGTRLRNISFVCVWLLCCVITALDVFKNISDFSLISFAFGIISFCSLSVLCVLIRPGPGEQGGARGRVDQSKRRAFYTILAILGVLSVRFTVCLVLFSVRCGVDDVGCLLLVSEVWFNFPSSLVLPLLFLQRAGALRASKKNGK